MTSRSLRGYAAFAEMPLPAERLWPWLVDPVLLLRWFAQSVELETREGGRFTARFADGALLTARVVCCEPARRLSLAFGPVPGWPGPACLTEDWIIDARPGRVILRVLGEGVPVDPAWATWLRRRQAGWKVALSRLRAQLGPAPAGT